MSRRVRRIVLIAGVVLVVMVVAALAWVGIRSSLARDELEAAVPLAQTAQSALVAGDGAAATAALNELSTHASTARALTGDPVFGAGTAVPFLGPNLAALRGIAVAVDDLTDDGLAPLVPLAGSVDPSSLAPVDGRIDLAPIVAAAPVLAEASGVFDAVETDVDALDTSATIGPVRDAVARLSSTVADAASALRIAATTAALAPAMLGADGDRQYLLLFQNTAELRATGGLFGAVALVSTSDGRIELTAQAGTSDFPYYPAPVLPVDPAARSLYGGDLGRYLQDVNYGPDFPTAAASAAEMWQRQFGQRVDGAIAVDPVVLGYLLAATGPITLVNGVVLDSANAVDYLLSQVYADNRDPVVQDLVFADAAQRSFAAITSGTSDVPALATAFATAADERRVLIWNTRPEEQAMLASTLFGGTLPSTNRDASDIAVSLNDATAGKMDFYLDAEAGTEVDSCVAGATTWTTTVRLTSSVPADAQLSEYVTGDGRAGVAIGTIRTRVAVYGPVGSYASTVTENGAAVPAQIEQHLGRGVAQVVVDLLPGESLTLTIEHEGATAPLGATELRMTPTIASHALESTRADCGD